MLDPKGCGRPLGSSICRTTWCVCWCPYAHPQRITAAHKANVSKSAYSESKGSTYSASRVTDHRRPQFCLPFQNTSLKPKRVCLNTKRVDIYLTPRASPNHWGQIFVEPLGVYASVRTRRGWKISDINGSCLAHTYTQRRCGPTAEHMTEVKQNYATGPALTIAKERS